MTFLFYTQKTLAFFLLCAICLPFSSKAQVVTQNWSVGSGANPQAVAVDVLGNVYVANYTNNTVSKITAAGALTAVWASLPNGANPSDIAIDASGNVYTTNYGLGTISKITSNGMPTTWASLGADKGPFSLVIDATGNVYTANQLSNTISKITAAGGVTVLFATLDMTAGPKDLAIDASGNLFTANYQNNSVSKVTPSGTVTPTWAGLANFSQPFSLAVDAAGNVYTANEGLETVSKIAADGELTQTWASTGSIPQAIAIDASNNVYTANFGDNTVTKIIPDGTPTQPWATLVSGAQPFDIAITPTGILYTANIGNNTISKITGAAVLPIELLSFSGKNREGGNLLTWTTANEVNNKGFQVERLMDNGQWTILGFKTANNKAATYQFTDNSPLATSYYRLRQIDNDGKETLSKVVSIQSKDKSKVKIYPSITNDLLTVEGAVSFDIVNVAGQIAMQQDARNFENSVNLNLSGLSSGIYFVRGKNTEGGYFVEKVVKQ